jgi:exodeoxyribonuclease VII large subunit
VGHEIDFTLCDFAADVRAETPSGAAELISSHYVAWRERLERSGEVLESLIEDSLARAVEKLQHARSRLRLLTPHAAVERSYLKLDDLGNRLNAALRNSTQERRERLGNVRSRLQAASPEKRVQNDSQRLLAMWKRLESVSPASVLKRGFVIVRDAGGHPVSRAKTISSGQLLVNEFHDGSVRVRSE